MKFKKLIALGLAAVMAFGLVACGGGEESTTAGEPAEVVAGGEVDRSKELVVYSNSTMNDQDTWLLEASAEAGFNLNIVSIDGAALADRLIAEKDNPVCDVVFGLNAVEYERLKAQNVLMKYEPEWVDKVDMSLGDDEGFYYPVVVQPLFLMYNTDVVTNPPAAWEDLVKEEYKEQYNMFQLSGGTAKMITSAILQKYQDPDGEYGISDEGWELIEKLYANCHYQQDGEDYVGNVVDGKVPMSEMWGAGVIKFQKERNTTFGLMMPEEGCPFVVEQMGIINGTENAELALDFINWFGAAEQQKGWSDNAGAIPANEDALAMVEDEGIKDMMANTKVMDVDWGFVAENVNDWVEKIELEYLE